MDILSISGTISRYDAYTKTVTISVADDYMLDLKEDLMMIVLLLEDYRCGMMLNSNKVNLGLLHSIAIPKVKEA